MRERLPSSTSGSIHRVICGSIRDRCPPRQGRRARRPCSASSAWTGSTCSGGCSATRRRARSSSAPGATRRPTSPGRRCARRRAPSAGWTTWTTAASPIMSRPWSLSAARRGPRLLEHLEWRGRTLPRSWIDAGLPRARALILAADGELAEALAILDAAPGRPTLPFDGPACSLSVASSSVARTGSWRHGTRWQPALASSSGSGSPPWEQHARQEIARLGLRHRDPKS